MRTLFQLPPDSTASVDPADKPLDSSQEFSLSVAKLSVVDTAISFEDLSTASSYLLEDFSVTGSDINFDSAAFPLALAFKLALNDPALQTTVQMNTLASLSLEKQRYQFDQLQLSLSVKGEATGNKKLHANIGMNADVDIAQEIAKLESFTLAIEGIAVSSELTASAWSEEY